MPERSRYASRVADGLCVACGTCEPAEGRRKCATCLAVARQNAAWRRAAAADHGLCEACMRRERVEGRGNRCNPCADRYLERQLARARAKRSA